MRESDIVKQMLDYLRARHTFAFRLGTGTIILPYKGTMRAFRGHDLGPGAADIMVPPEGTIWIEVKNERGRQSAAQKSFEQMVTAFGHKYILGRSVDDLKGKV